MTNTRRFHTSGTKRTANGLPINTAGNLGKLHGSTEWKGREQFMTANHSLSDTLVDARLVGGAFLFRAHRPERDKKHSARFIA
jgi:hypothetical protein